MINFHKLRGVPEDVTTGEDHIWFTDFGTIYVADNEGHAIPMGAGQIVGKSIPVGTPHAPNIIYFCQDNGKHYISSDKEWLEIPIKTLPGSGAAPGTAGSVIITDPGDYYSSNDVEGALYEIGNQFSHLMGSGQLTELTYNVFNYDTAGERLLGSKATNRPSNAPGWLNQRQDKDGNTYGLVTDSLGDAYVRYNDEFFKLASQADLDQLLMDVGTEVEGATNKRVIAGYGLEGGGLISNNPRLSIDRDVIVSLIQANKEDLNFLPLTGGTLSGNLSIHKRIPVLSLFDTRENSKMSLGVTTGLFTMRDETAGFNFFKYDMDNGLMTLNAGNKGGGIYAQGILNVESVSGEYYHPEAYPFQVTNRGKNNIARFIGEGGTIAIRSFPSFNAIQSTDDTYSGASKDLRISGLHERTMKNFLVNAYESRFSNAVIAGHGMWVAMGHDGYGTGGVNSRYHMFPFHYNPSMSASEARKYFAQMGFNQANGSIEFRSYKKDTAKHYSQWAEQSLSLSASKFVQRSSEKFKDVIGEFEEDALATVKETVPYLYTFKDDVNKQVNLGFILERGVPEEAIEEGGESIDTYAMVAFLWKAVQQLTEQVEKLQEEKE